jgi:organic radical activating enzyme
MENRQSLKLWYVSALRRCNFRCAYCASNQPAIKDRLEWKKPEEADTHQQIVQWITKLPYQIQLRMNSIGEPFTSKGYLDSVAQLSHAENIQFVEILTNGSFAKSQFEAFSKKVNMKKLSLWMTFHHTQIPMETFLAAAMQAQESGASVVVHALIFPDSIDSTIRLKAECKQRGLTFHSVVGFNHNKAYKENSSVIPALTKENWPIIHKLDSGSSVPVLAAAMKPASFECSAGHQYFFISSRGNVYRCKPYSEGGPESALGSALDPQFLPPIRKKKYLVCAHQRSCICVEDHQHLKGIKVKKTKRNSFISLSKIDFE